MGQFRYEFEKVNIENMPKRISRVYDMVFEEISKGNIHVARDKAKDVLELCLKYPIILFFSYMEEYIMDDDNEIDDIRIMYPKALRIVESILERKISLGDWQELCHDIGLLKDEDIPVNNQNIKICYNLLAVMKNISPAYLNMRWFNGKNFAAVRNTVWGHSATNTDINEANDILEKLLKTIHSILSLSKYIFIETFDDIKPFKIVSADCGESLECYYIKDKAILESISLKNRTVTFLNYENGDKEDDNSLIVRIAELKRKIDFQYPVDKDIDKDEIYEEDIENLKASSSKDIIANTIFYNSLREELAKSKGIIWIKAERGMGKTVFSRCICDNDIDSLDCQEKNYKDKKGLVSGEMPSNTDFRIWCFNCKDTLLTSKMVFRNQLKQFLFKGFINVAHLSKAEEAFWEEFKKDDVDDVRLKQLFGEYLKVAYRQLNRNGNLKLVIVIDGLEEINYASDGDLIFSELLSVDNLPDNVYIVILSRTDDEVKLGNYGLNRLATAVYEFFRDNDTYRKDLKRYIKKYINNQLNKDYIDDLLAKADYRFWNLVNLKISYKSNSIENNFLAVTRNISDVVDMYLGTIPSKKYRQQALQFLILLSILRYPVRCEEFSSLLLKRYGSVNILILDLLRRLSGFIKIDKKFSEDKMLAINLISLSYDELYTEFKKEHYNSIRENVVMGIEEELLRIFGDSDTGEVDSDYLINLDANKALSICHMINVVVNESSRISIVSKLLDWYFQFLNLVRTNADVIKYTGYWKEVINYTDANIKHLINKVLPKDHPIFEKVYPMIDIMVVGCSKDENKIIDVFGNGGIGKLSDLVEDPIEKELFLEFDSSISSQNKEEDINQYYKFVCENYDYLKNRDKQLIPLMASAFIMHLMVAADKGEFILDDALRCLSIIEENGDEFRRNDGSKFVLNSAGIIANMSFVCENVNVASQLFDVAQKLFYKYHEIEDRPEAKKANLDMEGKYYFYIANYLYKIKDYDKALSSIEESIRLYKQLSKINRFWMLNKDEKEILDSHIFHLFINKSMGCDNDWIIDKCERIINMADELSDLCNSDQRLSLAEYVIRLQRYLIKLYEENGDKESAEFRNIELESFCSKYGVRTEMYELEKLWEWDSVYL